MTFMIVASPCAVVLATMPPLLSAIANAGRHGVLVKSAVVMERLGRSTRWRWTRPARSPRARPRVTDIRALPGGRPAPSDELLALAAAAERPSEHPLARAVVAAARERGLAVPAAADFASAPGRGVTRHRRGARRVAVGSPARLLTASGAARRIDRAMVDGRAGGGPHRRRRRVDGGPVGVLAHRRPAAPRRRRHRRRPAPR